MRSFHLQVIFCRFRALTRTFLGRQRSRALGSGAQGDAAPDSKRFRRTATGISGMLTED